MSAGQLILGASVSLTVTVNVQVAVLPAASVAVQLTVVRPLAKKLPLGGLHPNFTPGHASLTTGFA